MSEYASALIRWVQRGFPTESESGADDRAECSESAIGYGTKERIGTGKPKLSPMSV